MLRDRFLPSRRDFRAIRAGHAPAHAFMQPIEQAGRDRLRRRLQEEGEDVDHMTRGEMVAALRAKGISEVDLRRPTRSAVTNRATDPTCVFVGHMAGYSETRPDQLVVSNCDTPTPLIGGDFGAHRVTIHDCLRLDETPGLSANTPGEVGDVRRQGNDLFMARRFDGRLKWYRMAFDYALE